MTSADRVVLVTGASSGIGKAIAVLLANEGATVFGTSRQSANDDSSLRQVRMIVMDVDQDESVNSAIAEILRATGRLDAVINCAGWALSGAVEDTSTEEAKAQMETNFFGALRVCRAVLPTMRAQGSGYVVNISSLGGVFGMPFSGMYSASKFALEGMCEALRMETRRMGIHVVLVEPGDFATQLPTQRRSTKLTSDAYRNVLDSQLAQQSKDEAKARTPEPVARLISSILETRRPRLRYSVGMPDQRIVILLKRFLPHTLFERIVGAAVGV